LNYAVTDHAAERYLQRVRGALDPKAEIIRRVASAWQAGRVEEGDRATVRVSDEARPDVVYVCRWDRPRGELLVVTLWEEGDDAAVPRRYTDALRDQPHRRTASSHHRLPASKRRGSSRPEAHEHGSPLIGAGRRSNGAARRQGG